MAIRCGMTGELPVRVTLVGKHWGELTIYRAAYAFEGAADLLLARGSGGNCSTLRRRAPGPPVLSR